MDPHPMDAYTAARARARQAEEHLRTLARLVQHVGSRLAGRDVAGTLFFSGPAQPPAGGAAPRPGGPYRATDWPDAAALEAAWAALQDARTACASAYAALPAEIRAELPDPIGASRQ